MDLYTPEISCLCGDNQTGIPSTAITNGLGVDLAKNVTAARAYDELHVQAVINQINGKHSSGNYAMQMPNLFGLNFQAVSVGQKVNTHACLPDGELKKSELAASPFQLRAHGCQQHLQTSTSAITCVCIACHNLYHTECWHHAIIRSRHKQQCHDYSS